jgi:hypothetical protein
MSQLITFAKSSILVLVIAGCAIGKLKDKANAEENSDRTGQSFSTISLPPPPQIEGLKSVSDRSATNAVESASDRSATNKPQQNLQPPTAPSSSETVMIPPPPPTPKYCYVGTWEMSDLSQYWLPIVQRFAQTKVTSRLTNGKAQITFTRDGFSIFEARNFVQKYKLKFNQKGNKINEWGLTLRGSATAEYTESKGMKLSFSSPSYRWLRSQLDLGEDLNVTGERLFNLYGAEGKKTVSLPYDCLDRDTIVLKLPVPKAKKSISITLKRIN